MVYNMLKSTFKFLAVTPAVAIPLLMYAVLAISCWTTIFAARYLFNGSDELASTALGYWQYSNPFTFELLIFTLGIFGIFPGQITYCDPSSTHWLRSRLYLSSTHLLPQPMLTLDQNGPSGQSWYPYVTASALLVGYWAFVISCDGMKLMKEYYEVNVHLWNDISATRTISLQDTFLGPVVETSNENLVQSNPSAVETTDESVSDESACEEDQLQLEDPFIADQSEAPATPSSSRSLLPSLFASPPVSPCSSATTSDPACDHEYLEALNHDLEIDNDQLYAALAEAEHRAQATADCIKGLEEANSNLADEKAALETDRTYLSDKVRDAEAEANEVKASRDIARASLIDQAEEICNLQQRLSASDATKQIHVSTIVDLEKQLQKSKESNSATISVLQNELNKSAATSAQTEATYETAVADLKEELKKSEACSNMAVSDLQNKFSQAVTTSEEAKQAHEAIITQLKEELNDIKASSDARISGLQSELSQVSLSSTEAASVIINLKEELAIAKDDSKTVTASLQRIQQEVSAARNEVNEKESNCTEQQEMITSLQEEVKQQKEMITNTQAELEGKQTTMAAMNIEGTRLQESNNNLSAELEKQRTERQRLQTDNELGLQELTKLQEQVGNLQSQLEAKSNYDTLSTQTRQAEKHLAEARIKIESLDHAITEMHAVEALNEMERRDRADEYEQLQQKLDRVEAINASRSTSDSLNIQLQDKTTECEQLKSIIASLKAAAASSSASPPAASSSSNQDDRELTNLRSDLNKIREALKLKETQIKKHESDTRYQKGQMSIMQNTLENYQRGAEFVIFFADNTLLPDQVLKYLLQDQADRYFVRTHEASTLQSLHSSLGKESKTLKLKTHSDKFPRPMAKTIDAIARVVDAAKEVLLADFVLRIATAQANPAYQRALSNCFTANRKTNGQCCLLLLAAARAKFDPVGWRQWEAARKTWVNIMESRGYNQKLFDGKYPECGFLLA